MAENILSAVNRPALLQALLDLLVFFRLLQYVK